MKKGLALILLLMMAGFPIDSLAEGEIAHSLPAVAADYDITIESCNTVGNAMTLVGEITPAIETNLQIDITSENTSPITQTITTNEDGSFVFNYNIPERDETITYDVKVGAPEVEFTYTEELSDAFSEDSSGKYLVHNQINRDDTTGNPAPSMKVSTEPGETNPRLLSSSESLRNHKTGSVKIKADIMKPEKSASDRILRSMEYVGNYAAYTIKSDSTKIYAETTEGSATLVENYTEGNWYSLEIIAYVKSRRVEFWVNDEYKGMLSYQNSTVIDNLARTIDSKSSGSTHYLDNLFVYKGTSIDEILFANSAETTVKIYGTEYEDEAIEAVNNATVDNLFNKLLEYNNAFNLDLSAADTLNKTEMAQFIVNEEYDTIASLKISYQKALLVQKLKLRNNDEKDLFTANAPLCNISMENINLDSTSFVNIIRSSIDFVETQADFVNLLEKSEICSNILDSTRLTAVEAVSKYVDKLKTVYQLSADYENLNSDEKTLAAAAIFDTTYTDFESSTIMSALVSEINKKTVSIILENNTQSTGGGSSGGGGGGGSNKPRPSSMDAITTPQIPQKEEINEETVCEIYDDVDSEHWAYKAITYLSDKGVISGRDTGVFDADSTVKREEIVKMIVLATKLGEESGELNFLDVDADSWYAPYVLTAVKYGVIKGIDDKSFGSGMEVSREDAVVMICRSLGLDNESFDGQLLFTDRDDISGYAIKAVSIMTQRNVISGMGDGSFMPKQKLTRAQAAQLIFNAVYSSAKN